MVVQLPGYYFDTEKKRYFKITTTRSTNDNPAENFNREAIRKKDRQQEYENLLQSYQQRYEQVQNINLSRSISLLERRKTTNREGLPENFMDNDHYLEMISVAKEEHNFPYIADVLALKKISVRQDGVSRTFTRYITKSGQVLETNDNSPADSVKVIYKIDDLAENELIELINFQPFAEDEKNLFIHLRRNETTHIFLTCNLQNSTSIVTEYKRRNINISASLLVDGKFLIFLSENKIYIDFLDTLRRSDFPLKKFPLVYGTTSQLTSIATFKINDEKIRIYGSTRDGQLISFVLDVKSSMHIQKERQFQSPGGLITIVSLRSGLSDGVVFVSGLENKNSNQTIIAFNVLSLLSTTSTLLKVHSQFQNLTTEKEIFYVCTKSCWIFYGTLGGLNNLANFELYSIPKSVTEYGTFEVPMLLTSYTFSNIIKARFPDNSFRLVNMNMFKKNYRSEDTSDNKIKTCMPVLDVLVEDTSDHTHYILSIVV